MKIRLLVFLSALSVMLLGMTEGLRAQPQETGRRTASHRLRVGRASRRRPHAGNHAELLRARAIRRRLCGPPRRLSDLHDDEFRLHRDRHLSGRARVLRQRGVCAVRERKEREGRRDRFFCAGVHRGFRRSRSRAGRLPGQAHARFDDAAGRAGQRADDGGDRQVRRRLHPGLQARRDHPRRRRGDAARFRQGTAAGRLCAAAQQRQCLRGGRFDAREGQRRSDRAHPHCAAQGWTDRQSARPQRRAVAARLRVPDRRLRELHPAEQEAGPDRSSGRRSRTPRITPTAPAPTTRSTRRG